MNKLLKSILIALALLPSLTFAQQYQNQSIIVGAGGTFLKATSSNPLTVGTVLATSTTATSSLQKTSITGAVSILGEYFTNLTTYVRSLFSNGTGISIAGGVVTNTAPDQTVVLNNGTNISVTGTYPTFTINSTGGSGVGWASSTDPQSIYFTGTNFVGIGSSTPSSSLSILGNNGATGAGPAINAPTVLYIQGGTGGINSLFGGTYGKGGGYIFNGGIGGGGNVLGSDLYAGPGGDLSIIGGPGGSANDTCGGCGVMYAGNGGNITISGGKAGIATNGSSNFQANPGNVLLSTLGGNTGIGTTSPYARLSVVGQIVGEYFTGTSTATSTFGGNLAINGTGTTTSTGGFNITAGCFAISGTCVTGGVATLSGGSPNTLAYWTSGTTVSATSSPTVGYVTATSTATSTFAGGIIVGPKNIDSVYQTGNVPLVVTSNSSSFGGPGIMTLALPIKSSIYSDSMRFGIDNTTNASVGQSYIQSVNDTSGTPFNTNLLLNPLGGGIAINGSFADSGDVLAVAAGNSSSNAYFRIRNIDSTSAHPYAGITFSDTPASAGSNTTYQKGGIFMNFIDPYATGYARGKMQFVVDGVASNINAQNNIEQSTMLTLDYRNGGLTGIGTTSPYAFLAISNSKSTTANTPLLTIASTTNGISTSTLMTVLATGNVGIGTTSPVAKLSVTGTGLTTGKAFVITDSSNVEKFTVLDNGTLTVSGTATSTFSGAVRATCFTTDGSTCINGTGGSQTPWTSNINGGGYNLTNVGTISTNASVLVGNSGTLGTVNISSSAISNTNGLIIQNGAISGDTQFQSWISGGWKNTMTLKAASYNIGIGTTSPYAKLSISNSATDAVNTPLFTIASTTNGISTTTLFTIDASGHQFSSGGIPACDANCTFVAGNDNAFRIKIGVAKTTTTITFNTTWGKLAPICVANEGSAGVVTVNASSTPTTVVLTALSALTSVDIDVICKGIQ